MHKLATLISASLSIASLAACSSSSSPKPGPGGLCDSSSTLSATMADVPLTQRAYVVSKDSGNVTVIDLTRLEVMGSLNTCGVRDHMAELTADFSKIYVDSPGTQESIVIDARTLQITKRIPVGAEDTHLSLSRDGRILAIVNEFDDSVSFVDTERDEVKKTLPGFYVPHFVRFAPDGRYAYVANLAAYHLSRVDLSTLAIDATIALDGYEVPANVPPPTLGEQSGFADAQIDGDGILYAAHAKTGRVLVYDTKAQAKLAELPVGNNPWIVYAQHPFPQVTQHVVPNFGDQTVSLIERAPLATGATIQGADRESFGVNYSPLAADMAFVMNRYKDEIAVMNTRTAQLTGKIPVGGNTETAATTADGKYIVAAVSSANRVVVIDAATQTVVKTFDNIGQYPWSVTIPLGQNYCH
jgi:YVTN family beta-propeller protein